MRRPFISLLFILGLLGAAARPASADVLLTPFAGVSFLDDSTRKPVYGVGLAFGGLIGLEAEVGRTQLTNDSIGGVPVNFDTNLTTGMVNLMLRLPAGPIQPYATAGVGVMRVSGDVTVPFLGSVISLSGSDFGMNVGGGVYVFPSDLIGLRADARYYRTLGDLTIGDLTDIGGLDDLPLPRFDFWRITGGVTLRF